jgi:predicted membrane channel-forming protein YqfA (hemolysin III family)
MRQVNLPQIVQRKERTLLTIVVNIWTHLLGACLFFALTPFAYIEIIPRYRTAVSGDGLALVIFFSGVVICFVLSTM